MRSTTQFSVFLINKPGILAQLIGAIADSKINLVALTISDAQEHGVLRLVGSDHDRLRQVLRKLNLPMHESEVLVVDLPNRPGALATVVGDLANGHVNIEYAYVTAGTPRGRTIGILKVDNLIKAQKALTTRPPRKPKRTTVRSRTGRRTG